MAAARVIKPLLLLLFYVAAARAIKPFLLLLLFYVAAARAIKPFLLLLLFYVSVYKFICVVISCVCMNYSPTKAKQSPLFFKHKFNVILFGIRVPVQMEPFLWHS